jgi:multiple antibiotic resistance protein
MAEFFRVSMLLFMLLNPFLLVVYLMDVFEKLPPETFRRVIVRAGLISFVVFSVFALIGDAVFRDVLQADFASFQVFGGIVFLVIGLRFVFQGNAAIEGLRGESQHIAGSIAMPLMIGPGTIGAAVIAGKRLTPPMAITSVFMTVAVSVVVMMLLKKAHDWVRTRNAALVDRYIEIAGRVTALVVGTFAIEMIMRGIATWREVLQ